MPKKHLTKSNTQSWGKKPLSKPRTEFYKLILSIHTSLRATSRSPTLRN